MLKAFISTLTQLLNSKKAAYSFSAALGASVLHVYFKISIQDALLLVAPLGVATAAQAHVDATAAKHAKPAEAAATVTEAAATAAPPATPPTAGSATAETEASSVKTDG